MVVVAPHPDDEVYGCGGSLLRHVNVGDRVVVVIVTDGGRSRAAGLSPAEAPLVRRREAEEAVWELGAELRWLGLPEGEWTPGDLTSLLGQVLEEDRPDLVYAPSRVDFHPEHLRVAARLSEALRHASRLASGPRIRVYAVQVPLTPLLANLVTPLAGQEARWRAALDRHRSQRGTLRGAVRLRRYAASLHRAGRLAEELWEMSCDEYRTLHKDPAAWLGVSTGFRGIRSLPFADPLAYRVGRRERVRLRELVETGSPEEGSPMSTAEEGLDRLGGSSGP